MRASVDAQRGRGSEQESDGPITPGESANGTDVAPTPRAGPTEVANPAAILRVFPALAVPEFRLLWGGMLPATLAFQAGVVATGYAAFRLSESAAVLGLVNAAMSLPMALFALLGGVAADRLSRRMLLLGTQSALGLIGACIALLAAGGALQVWHLVVAGIVQGTAFAFNMPARQAYIGELVGRRLLSNAVAINNAGMNFCRIAGPALAGGLIAIPAVGLPGVFAVVALLYGLVVLSLLRLPGRPRGKDEAAKTRPGGWADLLEGLNYIRSSPRLRALLGLAFVAVFFGMPFQTLMPLFSERVFEVGAAGLGLLLTAVGVGALAGSLTVAALSGSGRGSTIQTFVGVGFGLALIGFALSPTFAVALVLLVAVGFTSSAYQALNNTLIMGATEPRLYGRVMSVYMLTFALMPLGTLPASWLADHVGGRPVIAVSGAIVAVGVLVFRALAGREVSEQRHTS